MSNNSYFNKEQSNVLKDWLSDDNKKYQQEKVDKEKMEVVYSVLSLHIMVWGCFLYGILSNI
jgi:hypothetical protein